MKKIIHYDLFSGIGGFSLAADQVWDNVEHVFCDIDPFCRAVTQKHWPKSKHYADIRQFIANAEMGKSRKQTEQERGKDIGGRNQKCFLVTGGFPCQPFSQAGRRRGMADNRYLWPEMFRVIQLTKPKWVIAENVSGFVTMQSGMVLEQVCLDLESENYEVQSFIIPAVSVNAPHRRDRVWIVAYAENADRGRSTDKKNQGGRIKKIGRPDSNVSDTDRQRSGTQKYDNNKNGAESNERWQEQLQHRTNGQNNNAQNPIGKRSRGRVESRRQVLERQGTEVENARPSWGENWIEVATRLCGVDARVSTWVDGRGKIRNSRNERLKALGNSIVPQVVEKIFEGIKNYDQIN